MTSGAPPPDSYEFKAIEGQSRPPNARFYDSLTGFAQYKATPADWVAMVLPNEVEITAARVHVSVRLLMFILLPGAHLTDAVDDGEVSLFPLPLPLSSLQTESSLTMSSDHLTGSPSAIPQNRNMFTSAQVSGTETDMRDPTRHGEGNRAIFVLQKRQCRAN